MATSNKKRSVTTATASAPSSAPVKTNRSAVAEFNPDYTYVKKDLAKIGIMAGSFITILVILSFFLR
ncbi:MAG: hypothetical protein ACD_34C00379G0004 [uncultured bacterium]|nr:MAG: hypothetical protein ACD_34C00379G0004 [uncultured bacterium]HCS38732.1 hypothetical protein [Anaerolineaceae bacterium]